MDHYEIVENLRIKANVTYEEAKAALEASDLDMLMGVINSETKLRVDAAVRHAEGGNSFGGFLIFGHYGLEMQWRI